MPTFSRKQYPAIPRDLINPNDLSQLARILVSIRECVEILLRLRGAATSSAVTVQDLIDLGLVTEEDIRIKLAQRTSAP